MRTLLVALALVMLPTIAGAGNPPPGFDDTLVAGGLSQPDAIAFLPDGRMLIAEKGGALKLSDGGTPSTLITISVCTGSEMGLLGVAVDPSFGVNGGFIYLYRTDSSGGCTARRAGSIRSCV